jgi:hypothetical protein
LGEQKNEGVVGDQGIDAMLFEDAKIAVLGRDHQDGKPSG